MSSTVVVPIHIAGELESVVGLFLLVAQRAKIKKNTLPLELHELHGITWAA